jgi:hypothetical protein
MMIGHFDEILRFLEDDMVPFNDITPFRGFEAPLEMKLYTLSLQHFNFWSIVSPFVVNCLLLRPRT